MIHLTQNAESYARNKTIHDKEQVIFVKKAFLSLKVGLPILFALCVWLSFSSLQETYAGDSNYDSDFAALWANEAYLKPDTANPRINVGYPTIAQDVELTFPDFVDVDGEIWAYHIYRNYTKGYKLTVARATSEDGIHFTDDVLVLDVGNPGTTEDAFASFPGIWYEDGTFYLVYESVGTGNIGGVFLATSTDGIHFTKHGKILEEGDAPWETLGVGTPSLYKEGDTWYLFYTSWEGTVSQIGVATGEDLFALTKHPNNPILRVGDEGEPDDGTVGKRKIVYEDGYYYMVYEFSSAVNAGYAFDYSEWSHTFARSDDLLNWTKYSQYNLLPTSDDKYGNDGPTILKIDGVTWIYYRYGDAPYSSYSRRERIANETNGGYDRAYEAEALGHALGQAEDEGWAANPTDDPDSGYLVYGPCATDVPLGENIAVVKAKIDDNTSDNLPVMRIDVYDRVANLILESRTINRGQFVSPDHYEFFSVPFVNTNPTHQIEFRVYWYNRSSLNADRVLLNYGNFSTQQPPLVPAPGATVTPGNYLAPNPSGDALRLQVDNHNKGPEEREYYYYNKFSDAAYTFQSGDYIEYDVKLNTYIAGAGGIDIAATDGTRFRGYAAWKDQNNLSGHPSADLSQFAYNAWYHRKLPVPAELIGKTAAGWELVGENDRVFHTYSALYDNIVVTDGSGNVRKAVFRDGDDSNRNESDLWKVARRIMSVEDLDIAPPAQPSPVPAPSPTPAPLTEYYNDNKDQLTDRYSFQYNGTGWTSGQHADNSGGTVRFSDEENDYLLFRFYGTDIGFYAETGPDQGIAAISIDGGQETAVDLYSPHRARNKLVWISSKMGYEEHTLKVRVTGTKNPASSGTSVANDGVKVDVSSGFRYYNDSAIGAGPLKFQYAGTGWTGENSEATSEGTIRYSNVTNDYATFSFSGNQIWWYSDLGENRGIAAVSVDGGPETFVDLYAPGPTRNKKMWTSPLLADGEHTLKIRVTGTRNAGSSGYYVLVDGVGLPQPSPVPPYYNESLVGTGELQFAYSGTGWVGENNPRTSGGTIRYSNVTDDYAIFRFSGTQIDWYTVTGPNRGIAAVSIDNGPETAVDLYTADAEWNAKVWSSPVLGNGEHLLKIRVAGTKHANSGGYYVLLDGVKLSPLSSAPSPYYNDHLAGSDPFEFAYSGTGWVSENAVQTSNGTVRYSNVANDEVAFTFTGKQIWWYSDPGTNRGIAAVSIDNGPETMVDLYSPDAAWNKIVWSSPVLTDGEHTLKIRVTGARHAGSDGAYVLVDGVGLTPPYHNDNATGSGLLEFDYNGTGWVHENDPTASEGTSSYSNVAEDTVSFAFEGSQIEWYSIRGSNRGIAAVSVDNGPETLVDLYSADIQWNKIVWRSPVLTPGEHTLRIRVTGNRHPASIGDYIVVDGLTVAGGEASPSTPASANPQGDYLELTVANTASGSHYYYRTFAEKTYTFRNGDYLEYDVRLLDDTAGAGGIEVTATDGTYFRIDADWLDANSVGGHPSSDLSEYAYNAWYHRKLPVPDAMIGKTALHWDLAGASQAHNAEYTAQYDNIAITDGNGTERFAVFESASDSNVNKLNFGSQASGALIVGNTP